MRERCANCGAMPDTIPCKDPNFVEYYCCQTYCLSKEKWNNIQAKVAYAEAAIWRDQANDEWRVMSRNSMPTVNESGWLELAEILFCSHAEVEKLFSLMINNN